MARLRGVAENENRGKSAPNLPGMADKYGGQGQWKAGNPLNV